MGRRDFPFVVPACGGVDKGSRLLQDASSPEHQESLGNFKNHHWSTALLWISFVIHATAECFHPLGNHGYRWYASLPYCLSPAPWELTCRAHLDVGSIRANIDVLEKGEYCPCSSLSVLNVSFQNLPYQNVPGQPIWVHMSKKSTNMAISLATKLPSWNVS